MEIPCPFLHWNCALSAWLTFDGRRTAAKVALVALDEATGRRHPRDHRAERRERCLCRQPPARGGSGTHNCRRIQPVSAGHRDKQTEIRRIDLDFLAQPVDMGFKGVS